MLLTVSLEMWLLTYTIKSQLMNAMSTKNITDVFRFREVTFIEVRDITGT